MFKFLQAMPLTSAYDNLCCLMAVSGAQERWYLDGHYYMYTQYLAEESAHRMLIEAVKITTRQLRIPFMAPLTAFQL